MFSTKVQYPPPPALEDPVADLMHRRQNRHQGEGGEGARRVGPPGRGRPSTSRLAPE